MSSKQVGQKHDWKSLGLTNSDKTIMKWTIAYEQKQQNNQVHN